MRESFVFHSEFIEDLPEEHRQRYMNYIYDYGIKEQVPELEGLELALWKKIQRRIDTDKSEYETRKEKNREKLAAWRARNNVTVTSGYNRLQEVTEGYTELQTVTPYTDTQRVYDTDTDIVNDYVNDIDIVNDIDTVAPGAPSPSAYSKRIFDILKAHNFPCAKNNEISFYQSDFSNGLKFLHSAPDFAHIHSDDVIAAVENFIKVYESPDTYIKTKCNFYSLVKRKDFYNFLPGNFVFDNFLNFRKQTKTEETVSKLYETESCPECGKKKLFWNEESQKFNCDGCRKVFTWEQIKGEVL